MNYISQISTKSIANSVTEFYGISVNDLSSRKRNGKISKARSVYFFLCRKLTSLSLPKIGSSIKRDHTTVMHSINKITSELGIYKDINFQIENIIKNIKEDEEKLIIIDNFKFDLLKLSQLNTSN